MIRNQIYKCPACGGLLCEYFDSATTESICFPNLAIGYSFKCCSCQGKWPAIWIETSLVPLIKDIAIKEFRRKIKRYKEIIEYMELDIKILSEELLGIK